MEPKSVMRNVAGFRTILYRFDGLCFGDERPSPNVNHGAGIDISHAVRDYLGLRSLGLVDWRFFEKADVPVGPWLLASCCLENAEAVVARSGSGTTRCSVLEY
jgi:hypothetical protein